MSIVTEGYVDSGDARLYFRSIGVGAHFGCDVDRNSRRSHQNGPASQDTLGRVLSLLKPAKLQAVFLEWIASLAVTDGGAD